MIPKVTFDTINYRAKAQEPQKQEDAEELETVVLENTFSNRMLGNFHRSMDAFITYPVKGLTGDVNSNFYEFLAMGRIPYILGSATFIGVFNAASKYFDARSCNQSKISGLKFATGVVMYLTAKALSKGLVSRPVAWATGVDIEHPYLNVIHPFPKVVESNHSKAGENPIAIQDLTPQLQYQKLWESKEFPRIDLVDKDFHDMVARKNGLGLGLNCSENETKPIIKNIISTATTAQRVSSFLWGACGVALAACGDWDKFYRTYLSKSALGNFVPDTNKTALGNLKEFACITLKNLKVAFKALKDTTITSAKEMYFGAEGATGFKKHAGKALVWTAVASTVLGVANTIIRARAMGKNLCNQNVIDKSKDSVAV